MAAGEVGLTGCWEIHPDAVMILPRNKRRKKIFIVSMVEISSRLVKYIMK